MCRVLVRWQEKARYLADDAKYEMAHSRRGDIIAVFPDGHVWGREEGLPNYVSVDLTGVPVDDIKKYMVPAYSAILGPNGEKQMLKKRKYNILIDNLPQAILNILAADGKITVSRANITGRIYNRITGTTE
jgi:hypothetical protein